MTISTTDGKEDNFTHHKPSLLTRQYRMAQN